MQTVCISLNTSSKKKERKEKKMREISVKEIKRVTDKKQPPAWLIEAGKKVNKVSIDIDAPIINKEGIEDEINKRK